MKTLRQDIALLFFIFMPIFFVGYGKFLWAVNEDFIFQLIWVIGFSALFWIYHLLLIEVLE